MDLDEARVLMHEWVTGTALQVHMECVSICMDASARREQPRERERWAIAGLLHDFDYERHPTMEEHPLVGVAWLREHTDVDEEIIDAILGHADAGNTPRDTPMARYLFAVDELSGFLVACCKVRPNGIMDLAPKSVRKKLKTASFAAAVSREDINHGIEEIGADSNEHMQFCIDAIREHADRLGLSGDTGGD